MSKSLKRKDLTQHSLTRVLVVVTLSLSLAAFGCTTDRQLGNGDPVTTPGLRTSPTGGTTSGSETAPVPPPMMSSYSGTQSLQRVTPRSIQLSADEAAAVMAQHQPAVKVLGPSDPGPSSRPYASMANPSGQFVNPALRTNPQLTINSSISSQPVAAVTTGAGEIPGTAVVGSVGDLGINANLVTNPTIGNLVSAVTPTGSPAPVFLQSATVTPTNAAPLLSAGAFAGGTLSPTASSVVNPPASITATPRLAAVATRTNTATVLQTAPPVVPTPTLAPLTNSPTVAQATGTVGNPVRILRNENGRVVVTNVVRSR